jgi:hypothetical protein
MRAAHELVDRAFPRTPIVAEGAFTARGTTYPDAVSYTQAIAGKRWDEIDRTWLVRRHDALGFLGDEHLVAVLPVYLRALLDDGVWSPAAGIVIQVLGEPRKGFVRALSDAQRAAIAGVLHAFAEQDPDGSLGQAARAAASLYQTRSL